jgi:DUF1365 family protein
MPNSCIYKGTIGHQRRGHAANAFRYSQFMLYLDLDELDTVFKRHWLWSTQNPALARFRRRDHFGNPDQPLQDAIRQLIAARTGRPPASGPIRLLTHLSYFGYCFNPLSVYYCYDTHEKLQDIVLEVSNMPWGEQHCYVLAAEKNLSQEHHHFRFAKDFHVSPFMPMNMEYACRVTPPGDKLFLSLDNYRDGSRVFGSQLTMDRREINSANLAMALATDPLMTLRVSGLIHWQAAKLWLKRARYYQHPGKPTNTTHSEHSEHGTSTP